MAVLLPLTSIGGLLVPAAEQLQHGQQLCSGQASLGRVDRFGSSIQEMRRVVTAAAPRVNLPSDQPRCAPRRAPGRQVRLDLRRVVAPVTAQAAGALASPGGFSAPSRPCFSFASMKALSVSGSTSKSLAMDRWVRPLMTISLMSGQSLSCS